MPAAILPDDAKCRRRDCGGENEKNVKLLWLKYITLAKKV